MSQQHLPTIVHTNGFANTIMSAIASLIGLILILLISFVLMPSITQELSETGRMLEQIKSLRQDVDYLITVNKRLNAAMDANEARQKAMQKAKEDRERKEAIKKAKEKPKK